MKARMLGPCQGFWLAIGLTLLTLATGWCQMAGDLTKITHIGMKHNSAHAPRSVSTLR